MRYLFFQPGYLGKFSLKSCMQYPIEPNKRLVGINLTVGHFGNSDCGVWNKYQISKGAFTYVRCFWGIFDLPTYPNQILYYISLCSKIRCSLTYLPTQKIWRHMYVNALLEKNLALQAQSLLWKFQTQLTRKWRLKYWINVFRIWINDNRSA